MGYVLVWQGQVNERLRALLGTLGVPRATEYRSQDLRRGHYEDMRAQGRKLLGNPGCGGRPLSESLQTLS